MKKEDPLISVIVPVYNTERYLKKCVESILAQTYSNLQVLLVDDHSKDASLDVCRHYEKIDRRVEAVALPAHRGTSGARNCGLEKARGEYLAFVDSDDWIAPNYVSYLYSLALEYGADLCSVEIERCREEKTAVRQRTPEVKTYAREEYIRRFFKIGSQETVYYPVNKLYYRTLFWEGNRFDETVTIGEDIPVTYAVLLNCSEPIVASNQRLYFYRQGTGVTKTFSEGMLKIPTVWEQVIDMAKKNSSRHEVYARICRARSSFTVLSELAVAGQHRNPKYRKEVGRLLRNLKRDRKLLLRADINWTRKCMICLFLMNYDVAAFFISIFGRCFRWQ